MKKIILIAIAFFLLSLPVWAGDTNPSWTGPTTVSGTTLTGIGGTNTLTTIDSTGSFVVLIWANVYLEDESATGDAGISVFAVSDNSGVSAFMNPIAITSVNDTDYEQQTQETPAGTGVTYFVGQFTDQQYLLVGGGYDNSAENGSWFVTLRYSTMTLNTP